MAKTGIEFNFSPILKSSNIEKALDFLNQGLVILNNQGKILFFNKKAGELLRCKKHCSLEIFDDKGQLIKINKQLKTKKAKQYHKANFKKSGRQVFKADFMIVPLADEADKTAASLLIFKSVKQDEYCQTIGNDSISIASHHLRTPLSAIKWFLELLLAGDAGQLNKNQRELVKEIFIANNQMIELVNDLLSISRVEAGQFELKKQKVDLKKLIREVMKDCKYLASAKNVKLKTDFPAKELEISTDKKYLKIAVSNLLENAIKYNKKAGQAIIGCKVDQKNDRIKIIVRDTGLGIAPQDKIKVFSKFYRGRNVIAKEPVGTGLGLYFCKKLAEALKGKISFKSHLEKGSSFFLEFPIK